MLLATRWSLRAGKRHRTRVAEAFVDKINEWIERSGGRIRADVVHDKLQAQGYGGSARTTRRVVAALKAEYGLSTRTGPTVLRARGLQVGPIMRAHSTFDSRFCFCGNNGSVRRRPSPDERRSCAIVSRRRAARR